MAPFILGAVLLVVGAVLTAAEARACAYERKNIGPILALVGVGFLVGAGIDTLF
ncbi:hypothetical protein ACFP4H_23925 [Pseudophaeobacter arcticus]|uniref:hypothetical protein n=1 Tax=Pseudophaeobacter arcticus TaxID=385492 RepID=UPI00040B5197|nr:hypothetical protein [Pseudophaeobacter arcticus]